MSSSDHLVGLDLVDTSTRSKGTKSVDEYVQMFTQQLTVNEMQLISRYSEISFMPKSILVLNMSFIYRGRTEKDKYDIFYLIWSLKESFIKAIGLGLGYDLTKVVNRHVFKFVLAHAYFTLFLISLILSLKTKPTTL
jgi:phosphopantetheinyl transferase (holo-ACP synthase)